ncbi:MAG: ABC transporter permease, partial [Candidatus Thermoplasmatota archaeon]|nr:ABC transporter permease [Candidatus Thermoplasmatota archaeon]
RKIDDLGQDRMEYRMFEIVAIQDLKGPGLETGFMPSVPGLTDSPTCGSWDPGFDIDLDALDDNDTEYWESYRTAPKAYISIGDARELWSNPYGDTTAVLFPTNSTIEMDSGSLGISIIKVRENALGSSSALLIFPGMFLTFGSIMIIGALLILHAVIRDLGRSRSHEWGILRSMGMNRKGIYSSALGESAWSILTGIIIGIPLGYLLSLLLHAGLRSAWERSVESSSIPFHISIATLIFSVAVGSSVSLLLIMFSSWMETKQVVAVNLREKDASISSGTRRRLLFIGGAGTGAGLLIAIIGTGYGTSSAPTFFTISTILLSPGIAALIYSVISRTFRWGHTSLMVSANLSRRPGKHPLAVAILSMALALALSLTATGEIIQNGAEDRLDNYGGGFDLVVETTAPYAGDIELQGIDQAVFLSVGSEGGTCSNLNAVYPPRLLGAGEELLHGSNFDLAEQMDRTDGSTWEGLSGMRDDAYPILVDRNTLQWIYYRSLGDRFRLDDESGNAVELVVIGVLEPSILTGSFVMSWEHLRELFPSRAMATYILLGGEELEREWIEKEFSGYSPIVTSVEDLARENLESELSYLYLFRDLLVIGLVVSMTSAAIFTHVRALSLKKEIEVMRRIGATSRRTVNYFLLENLIIFLIAAAGSLTGSIITMVLFMDHLGSGGNLADVVLPTSVVIAAFLAVSILTALLSSIWAVGSSKRRNGPVQLE